MRQTFSVPSLKNLIVRDPEMADLLRDIPGTNGNAPFWIEQETGALLFGAPTAEPAGVYDVEVDGVLLGRVCGGPPAAYIARVLTRVARQESEKKKLGAEVLHLYREINRIYNFSEKLISAVSTDAVADMALEEAGRLIPFSAGAVMLREDENGVPEVLAQTGDFSCPPLDLLRAGHLYQDHTLCEHSDIVHFSDDRNGARALLYTPLRVRNRTFGAVLLSSRQPVQYTAADLKLLTTLTLQAATAMESATQQEAAAAKAYTAQQERFEDLFIRDLKAKLESNLSDENFALPELCRAIGISRSQLFRKMKTLVNDAPSRFIRAYRLQRAKQLLETTDLQVSEIAYRVGYKDPAYFSHSFQEEFGVTPGAVRRVEGE